MAIISRMMPDAIRWYDQNVSEVSRPAETVHGWLVDLLPNAPALILDVGAGGFSPEGVGTRAPGDDSLPAKISLPPNFSLPNSKTGAGVTRRSPASGASAAPRNARLFDDGCAGRRITRVIGTSGSLRRRCDFCQTLRSSVRA